MNKGTYRIIFNAARGTRVVVQETARGHSRGASGNTPARAPGKIQRPVARAVLLAAAVFYGTAAVAQILSDPGAPGHQRPTILQGPGGAPLVNIQTPSAAGVSHNTYRQFDVHEAGAILNNARGSNPWLATGSARVILNEVNSHAPSYLRGAISVNGDPAQVIVANPAGIQIDGASFVNASRVTLTTGSPRLEYGDVKGFDVRQGGIGIGARGLSTQGASYTDILARATYIAGNLNAGLGGELNVMTGTQFVDYASGATSPGSAWGGPPHVAIDVSSLGSMYAGKISLLATEAGVGVRNSGTAQAAGLLMVTAEGRLENTGRLQGAIVSAATSKGDIDNRGTMLASKLLMVSAGGDLSHAGAGFQQASTNSTSVLVRANRDVNIAEGSQVVSIGPGVSGTVTVSAGRDVNIAKGSAVEAGGNVVLSADRQVNINRAVVSAFRLGSNVEIEAQSAVQINHSRIAAGSDLKISSDWGDVNSTATSFQSGNETSMSADNGHLSLQAEAGTQGNPSARVASIEAGAAIHLTASTIKLQASDIRTSKDIDIIGHQGDVIFDGVRSTFSNYLPQAHVAALQREQSELDVRINAESNSAHYTGLLNEYNQASLAVRNSYRMGPDMRDRDYQRISQIGREKDQFLNGQIADLFAQPWQLNDKSLQRLRNSAHALRPYHQAIQALKKEQAELGGYIGILNQSTYGHESLGARIEGRAVRLNAMGGVALNGAHIKGHDVVSIRVAGALATDSPASTTGDSKPVSIATAGITDRYEVGQAGSDRHTWASRGTQTVIEGTAGVQLQAVGNANARMALNSTVIRAPQGAVLLQSSGDMIIEAGLKESYSFSQWSYKTGSWFNRKNVTETHVNQSASALPVSLYGNSVHLKSGGSIDAFATQFNATGGHIQITAANALNLYAVPEQIYSQADVQKKSRFLGIRYDKTTSVDTRQVESQLPAKLVAGSAATYSGWNTLLQGTVFETTLRGANIQVGVGDNARADASIILEGIKRRVVESRTKKSDMVVWQSDSGSGSTVETLYLPLFLGQGSPIFGGPVLAQIPEGDLKHQVSVLSQQPGMTYLQSISQLSSTQWYPVKLAFDQWSYSQQGLTPAGAALLAVAVAVATQGAGASMMGIPSGTTMASMANAAVSSLAAQASITLVNNGGNIAQTLRELASSSTAKAAIAAALTAGLIDKIGGMDSLQGLKNGTALSDKFAMNLINAGGRALTHTAITGGNLGDALKAGLLGALVDTVHGEAAGMIKGVNTNYFTHKLLHAIAGCGAGAAAGGSCRDGAIGAAVGEAVAELIPPANGIMYSDAEKARVLAYSKLVAGGVAAYAGGDAQTAITTAETAVTNNSLAVVTRVVAGILAGGDKVWTAYRDFAGCGSGTRRNENG